jgi:hypothetical protein
MSCLSPRRCVGDQNLGSVAARADSRSRTTLRRVLFAKRFWAGIADGSVTVTYRRWRRLQVLAGRRYRTPAGIVEVTAATTASPDQISDDDACRAGYPSAVDLIADLPDRPSVDLFRIEFQAVAGPDPRALLAAAADVDADASAEISRRLDRLDRASIRGPWTREVLGLIRDRPATRAADLAGVLGRETASFKVDVRKLKNLGLTESLDVGYRLSPRGHAFLAVTDTPMHD